MAATFALIPPRRAAYGLVVAFTVGISVAMVAFAIMGWTGADTYAYLNAADRLIAGQALYPVSADPGASEVYRYAPWFAVLWIPATWLPEGIVVAAWTGLLVMASVFAVFPLGAAAGRTPLLLAVFFGSFLFWTAARGNVQPLIIVALVHGIDRRSGPLWIALAASLKAVPILFVLAYAARREWRRLIWTCAIAAMLVAPMPAMGWRAPDPGESLSLYDQVSPTVWLVVGLLSIAIAIGAALMKSKFTPVAAALAAILALPRLHLYDATLLVAAGRWHVRIGPREPASQISATSPLRPSQ